MLIPDAKECMSTIVRSSVSCVGLTISWSSLPGTRGLLLPLPFSPWFQGTISHKVNYLLKQLLVEGRTNLMDTSIVKHAQGSETLEPKICALEGKKDGKLSCWQREMQAGC